MWNCFNNIKAKGHLTSMGSVSSVTQSCLTLCVSMECSMPGFPVHHQFPKVAQKHVCQVYDDIQPSHPWSSPSPPVFNFFPSIRIFSNESFLCIQWPKYWSLSFSISPPNEYSWLISLRIDWFDLLAIQRTLKSLLQHHGSKASFFNVQLSS